MHCSKIGGTCPHPIARDEKYVFVMMPFEGSTNVYDQIKLAVEGLGFACDRADEKYTNLSIWCKRICSNIRRAKYLIADTTGCNPNVFYELGFCHALEGTKALIITRSIEETPFDVRDLNHISYATENLPDLRDRLKKAITSLMEEEKKETSRPKTSEELSRELHAQLREEEKRAAKFKEDLLKTEEREEKLKEDIRELERIRENPEKEAKNRIALLEGTLAELKSKLKYTEEEKKEEVEAMRQRVREQEEKLKTLEKDLDQYRSKKDQAALPHFLLDEAQSRAEAKMWAFKAYNEKDLNKKIAYYTKAIELDPNDAIAYNNRGNSYNDLKEYGKAIEDLTKAIELDPNEAKAYNNRGNSYNDLKEYGKAIEDYTKAIELDPNYAKAYNNLSEVYLITGKYSDGLQTVEKALKLGLGLKDQYLSSYLECILKKILGKDTKESEERFHLLHEKGFSHKWSTEPIETWLPQAEIDEETRIYIREKTERLKSHA